MTHFYKQILAAALILWAQAATVNIALAAQQLVTISSADGRLSIPAFWFPADSTGNSQDAPRLKPVIIGLHGCGGPLGTHDKLSLHLARYAAYFNAESYHFLAPNSFAARGERSICGSSGAQRSINEADRREDVFAAMAWLSAQPDVDMKRVAVVGWSHGAQTVLSVMEANDSFVSAQPRQPLAAVAFYPGCFSQGKGSGYKLKAPLLLMIGELDNWTPARHCVAFHQRMRFSSGPPFELVVYPGSYHGFDGLSPVTERSGVGSTASGKATVGGNPEAMRASHQRLFDFLAQQFGSPLQLTLDQRLAVKP
jgi:dienelactone hydrolase